MAEYNAPLKDMNFVIRELANLDGIRHIEQFADATDDVVDQILDEAAKFARDVWGALYSAMCVTRLVLPFHRRDRPCGPAQSFRLWGYL